MRNQKFLDLAQSALKRFQNLENTVRGSHRGFNTSTPMHSGSDYINVKLIEKLSCQWYKIFIQDEILKDELGKKDAYLEVFYDKDEDKVSISREGAFATDNNLGRVLKVDEISSILDKVFKIHENYDYIRSKCSDDKFHEKMHAYMDYHKYPDISGKTQEELDEIAGVVENGKIFEEYEMFRDILFNEFANLTDDQKSVLSSVIRYNDISSFIYYCDRAKVLKRKIVNCDSYYVEIADNTSDFIAD